MLPKRSETAGSNPGRGRFGAAASSEKSGSARNLYRCALRKRLLLLAGLLVCLGALMVVAVGAGSYPLGWGTVLQALAGQAEGTAGIVVWKVRMPRILAAVVSGWALGLSGMAAQSLLKNPLASPFTLGISQGAAFGASFAIVFLGAGGIRAGAFQAGTESAFVLHDLYSVSLFALTGGLLATIVILLLALIRKLTPESIILAGVALSSLFVSGTILIQYFATETEIASVVFWTFGDVSRSTWKEILLIAVASALTSVFFLWNRWSLNALAAGEDTARGLGVRVDRLRLSGMFGAALAAALVTAFHGVIAFLGLLAPHIARRVVGADHQLLVPCSALVGALLLLGADTMGRGIVVSGSLPVGVLTSFMGAPLFLYLLLRGARR